LFALGFVVVGFIALQVPLMHVIGSKVSFTLFDAFSPISGAFLGGIIGAISVLVMQIANFITHGAHLSDTASVIRLFPMIFAALYFGRKSFINIAIPLIAMTAFIFHPIGRHVWYYPMYWWIPVICYFFQEKSLIARSLGATFTAHAIGSTLWLYVFNLPAPVWTSLIPIVAMERLLFTAGTSVAYLAVNAAFNFVNQKHWFSYQFPVKISPKLF